MKALRTVSRPETGSFIVLDDNRQLKTNVSEEVLQDYMGISIPNRENAEDFYKSNIHIAEKNKSDKPNDDDYYESSISTKDFT